MDFLLGIVTGIAVSALALLAYFIGVCWWIVRHPE